MNDNMIESRAPFAYACVSDLDTFQMQGVDASDNKRPPMR